MSDRRPPTFPPAWLTLFLTGYLALVGLVMLWAGMQLVDKSTRIGFSMTVLGVVTAFLGIRFFVKSVRTPAGPAAASSGDLPKEAFATIVLMAFALPLLLGGLLVVFAVTGNLGP